MNESAVPRSGYIIVENVIRMTILPRSGYAIHSRF